MVLNRQERLSSFANVIAAVAGDDSLLPGLVSWEVGIQDTDKVVKRG